MSNKFLLVSHILPPSPSGQAVMIYRLLKDFPASSYSLVSKYLYDPQYRRPDWSVKLPAKYFSFKKTYILPWENIFGLTTITQSINIIIATLSRSRRIIQIAKSEKCKGIICCTGSICDLPAAYLASVCLRIPLISYIFDDFIYQWTGIKRLYARLIGPLILKASKTVIVTNEFMKKEYFNRYKVNAKIVHNPAFDQKKAIKKNKKFFSKKYFNIVYMGAIYRAHYDAFSNLIIALYLLDETNVRLHLFTAQPLSELEIHGIDSPKLEYHPHIPHTDVSWIFKQADLLFLPLAFNSPIPEVIKTSSPGKASDYLASGKPILIHAPKNSFISWYFSKNKCGEVVTENNPKILTKHLSRLIVDKKTREQLAKKALYQAQKDFNQQQSQRKFNTIIKSIASS